jgi:hypothetical protein
MAQVCSGSHMYHTSRSFIMICTFLYYTRSHPLYSTVAQKVAPVLHIRQIRGLNHDPETGYPDYLRDFSQPLVAVNFVEAAGKVVTLCRTIRQELAGSG